MTDLNTRPPITVPEAVCALLRIVDQLRAAHGNRKPFTLDGRLVGDIGEVLAEREYDLTLYEKLERHHDATFGDGKRVQIKATMKDSLTFPGGHLPDFYLGIKILPDGTIEEIFNGPGKIAFRAVEKRQTPKTNLHSIPLHTLRALQAAVPPSERVPRR